MTKKTNIDLLDLVIIGNGPSGYTASIYASRYRVNHILIGMMPGGMITTAHKVCNYPGLKDVSGTEIAMIMRQQAKDLGMKELIKTVIGIEKIKNGTFIIKTKDENFKARSIIIASGTKRRHLSVDREKELTGKGVSYCATCDAMFYKDKRVAIAGGSDAATTAAILLADIASDVYLIYRGDSLRGEPAWVEKVLENKKIQILYNTNIVELKGKDRLERIILDEAYRGSKEIKLNGLFIEVGSGPENELAVDLKLDLDTKGYIKVAEDQSSSIKGVYAAGDITTNSSGFRQVVTACSEGSVAANSVYKFLKTK